VNFRRALDWLACPECRGLLREEGPPPVLRCCACGASYRVEEGVPILLAGASGPPASADQAKAWGRGGFPTRAAHRLRAWLNESPGRDRHQAARLAAFVSAAGDGDLVMDLGSGSRRLGDRVLAVDIGRFPHVDLVADGHRLPFRDGVAGRIVCTGVLEHVQVPERVVGEMVRILRPGGRIYAAVPFLQGFHPGSGTDADFQRRTHLGLMRLMTPLAVVEWGIAGGPSAALAWVLREYLALPFAWSRSLYKVVYLASGPLTSWLRWLDVLLDRFPQASRIACGFYVIAEKPVRLG
jgi:uncharacterized protein YbaR (Trm112 family)/SAM-dependent methyltransferase